MLNIDLSYYNLWILDLDGTIADTEYAVQTSLNSTIRSFNPTFSKHEELASVFGMPLVNIFQRYLLNENVEEAIAMYKENFLEVQLSHVNLFPGVKNILERLHKLNVELKIVTNRDSGIAIQILEYLRISHFFSQVLGSDQGLPKPSTELVLKALNGRESHPAAAIFLGDSNYDIEAANASKIPILVFRGQLNPPRVNLLNVLGTFHHWNELESLFLTQTDIVK